MAGGKSGGGIIAMAMRHSQIVIFVVCCLCAFGIYGLSEMRKNEFPEFTVRQGVVVAVCPGYTAAEMEERVVKPLENYIFEYKEVKKTKTKSMSRDGIAYIQVQLNDNLKDKDEFWSKFKHGVNDFKTQLPQSVLAPKVLDDFGDTSAMLVALESDQKTYNELSDYIDVLEAKLRRIVGRMTVYRMQQEQISIKIDHARLSQYALTEKALLSKLYTQGFVTSGGHIKNDGYESPIHVTPTANNEYEIAETVIFTAPAGNSLRLKDVAEIVREYPEPTSFIRNNGRKCLLLSVEMKPGFNMVQIGKNVNNEITDFEKSLPDDVYVYRITDQSKVVGDSVNNFLPEISLSGKGMAANEHLIQLPLQFPPELPIPLQNIQMVKNGLMANVTAMLPVYAGGQIYYGNRLAKVGTEVEQLKLKQSENEVRMAVTQYYWQIILLKEKVKTVEAINLQLASIYENAEAAYQAGVSTRNDVLQVDLKKNEMESASLELNNNIEILKMLLAQFIGISEATSFDVGSGSLSLMEWRIHSQ